MNLKKNLEEKKSLLTQIFFHSYRHGRFLLPAILAGWISIACVEVKDRDLNQKQKTEITKFDYMILGSEILNQFEVQLSYPNKKYVIYRKALSKDADNIIGKVTELHAQSNSTYIDNNIKPGEDYIYSFGNMNELKFVEEARLLVSIPVDLKIEKNSRLVIDPNNLKQISNLARIRRLVLLEDSEILTGGQTLVFKVRELKSFGGKISSFPIGNSAAESSNGLDGGSVTLFAERAEGELEINLNGQKGGDGSKGSPATKLDTAGTGAIGKNGGSGGEFRYSIQDSHGFHLTENTQRGLKGIGGPGGNGLLWTYCPPNKEGRGGGCEDHNVPSGAKGPDGQDGTDGRFCEALNKDEKAIFDVYNYSCH